MRQISRLLVGLMLTFLAALPMYAQQENAAFYIYQNDGHFDGFFYDEVQKISYSVLDTLGVEHDEIVSQEIVTADSIYRIMLSAIDSVGFVQPEIKFNPKLKDMGKTGLANYLTNRSTETNGETKMSFYIPKDREDLIPKEDDILVDFYAEYGGHVKSLNVDRSWYNGIMVDVVVDPISSFKDIFEQFTTVEEYQADQSGHLVRRRMAGIPEMNVGEFPTKAKRRADSSLEFDFFKFALNRHFALFTDTTENWNISIDINTETAISARASWNFTDRKYVGLTIKIKPSLAMGFTVDYKFKDVFPGWINETAAIYIPAAAPMFKINLLPDAFFRGDCHATMNFQTPKLQGQMWLKLEADFEKEDLRDMWGVRAGFGTPPGENALEPLEESEANTWSGTMEFNGFVQTGIQQKFAFGTGKLLSWLIDSSVEATTYIGPKLSGALNFSISNVIGDKMSVYNLIKDSKLTFNPIAVDFESKAKVSTWLTGEREITLMDGSMNIPILGLTEVEAYAFPEFEMDVEVANDEYNTHIGFKKATVTVKPSRNVLKSVDFGAGVFNHEGTMIDGMFGSELGLPKYGLLEMSWPKDSVFTYTFHSIPKNEQFEIRPIFKMGSFDVVAAPSYTIDGLYFRCQDVPPLIFDHANPQPITFSVETNALRAETSFGCKAEVSDSTITLQLDKELFSNTDKHRSSYSDSGYLVLKNNEEELRTSDVLNVLILGDMKYSKMGISPYMYGNASNDWGYLPASCEVTDTQGGETDPYFLTRTCVATSKGTDGDPNSEFGQTTWDLSYSFNNQFSKEQVNIPSYGKCYWFDLKQNILTGKAYIKNIKKFNWDGNLQYRDHIFSIDKTAEMTSEVTMSFNGSDSPIDFAETVTIKDINGNTETHTWNTPKSKIYVRLE